MTSQALVTQSGIKGFIRMPFKAAGKIAEDNLMHCKDTLAICEGSYNGTYFSPEELEAMVQLHNSEGSVSQVRICEDHIDYLLNLLGRAEALRTHTDDTHGLCVDLDFALFTRTERQKEVLIQLEQAPDLIGLSICVEGNLNPEEMTAEDGTRYIRWSWSNLRLIHVAICTDPACTATNGSISMTYKRADGTEINPSIFMSEPTYETMTSTPSPSEPAEPQAAPSAEPQPQEAGTADFKEAQAFAYKVGRLSADIGIDPSPEVMGALTTAEQRAAYVTDLQKIAESFAAQKTVPQTAEPQAMPQKGTEFSAGSNTEDTVAQTAKEFMSGTGKFSHLGAPINKEGGTQ